MPEHSLIRQYAKLEDNLSTLFVVPLIRFSQPETDYLYNLYRTCLESADAQTQYVKIKSLSVFAHYRFVWARMTGQPVLLHYHWLEFQDVKAAAGMVWKLFCLLLYKLLGGKLVWTIHNKKPHRGKWLTLNYFVRRWMARRADKLHVHCESVIPGLSQYFQVPSQKFFVHPHPRFPAHIYDRDKAISSLRKHYDLPVDTQQRLFLMFGNIARYKRIGEVINLFENLPSSNRLLVAGKVKKGNGNYFASIRKMADRQKNIHLVDRHIPEEHISWFFNGVDYLIYNHRHLIVSGVVELARSYKKEIIAPRAGCLQEMESRSNLLLFDNQDELRDHLRSVALNSS